MQKILKGFIFPLIRPHLFFFSLRHLCLLWQLHKSKWDVGGGSQGRKCVGEENGNAVGPAATLLCFAGRPEWASDEGFGRRSSVGLSLSFCVVGDGAGSAWERQWALLGRLINTAGVAPRPNSFKELPTPWWVVWWFRVWILFLICLAVSNFLVLNVYGSSQKDIPLLPTHDVSII